MEDAEITQIHATIITESGQLVAEVPVIGVAEQEQEEITAAQGQMVVLPQEKLFAQIPVDIRVDQQLAVELEVIAQEQLTPELVQELSIITEPITIPVIESERTLQTVEGAAVVEEISLDETISAEELRIIIDEQNKVRLTQVELRNLQAEQIAEHVTVEIVTPSEELSIIPAETERMQVVGEIVSEVVAPIETIISPEEIVQEEAITELRIIEEDAKIINFEVAQTELIMTQEILEQQIATELRIVEDVEVVASEIVQAPIQQVIVGQETITIEEATPLTIINNEELVKIEVTPSGVIMTQIEQEIIPEMAAEELRIIEDGELVKGESPIVQEGTPIQQVIVGQEDTTIITIEEATPLTIINNEEQVRIVVAPIAEITSVEEITEEEVQQIQSLSIVDERLANVEIVALPSSQVIVLQEGQIASEEGIQGLQLEGNESFIQLEVLAEIDGQQLKLTTPIVVESIL